MKHKSQNKSNSSAKINMSTWPAINLDGTKAYTVDSLKQCLLPKSSHVASYTT